MTENTTINIKEYILMFKKRKLIILLIMSISLVCGFGLKYMKEKSQVLTYQTSARIRINTAKNNSEIGFSPATTSLNQSISNTYLSLAKSKYTLNEMKKILKSDLSPEAIGSKYSLTADEVNPEFVNINVIDTDPKRAAKIANAVPTAFNNELKKTINIDCIQVIDKASEPKYPLPTVKSDAPKKMLIVGGVISIFVVLLLEFLNNKIVTPKDVEEYWEIPLLGVVPYEKPQKEKRLKTKEAGGI